MTEHSLVLPHAPRVLFRHGGALRPDGTPIWVYPQTNPAGVSLLRPGNPG